MAKRKKSSSTTTTAATTTNNPLSDARRQTQTSSSKPVSKADQTAINLWHRKSGAGYALFVSYYGAQPMGVVAEQKIVDTLSNNSVGDTNFRQKQKQQGKGQSRAAKRRKKRKLGASSAVHDDEPVDSSLPASPQLLHNDHHRLNDSHPLFQAFNSNGRAKQYPHLLKYINALSRSLPLTFRLRKEGSAATAQHDAVIQELQSSQHNNLVSVVKYDPSQTIYQATAESELSKSNLSKVSPSLKELLVNGSQDGTLARQELGSMLPVLCLSAGNWLKPGSKVLDLCASPGSKTLQALEIAASSSSSPKRNETKNAKLGRVIANDVHSARLDSLKDAVDRSGLDDILTSRVTYTNFDASVFPPPKSGKLFDAIIADVPCSGDGTIRKDKHILPNWSPATGNALHGLQLKILMRALELIKVGGVVCYSTCSLNPVEDEAVVAAALKRMCNKNARKKNGDVKVEKDVQSAPAVELIEWPKDLLPDFKRRPGVEQWRIAGYSNSVDKDSTSDDDEGDVNDDFGQLSWYDSYEKAKEAGMAYVEETMWHPDEDENEEHGINLKYCSRLWPQDQDTGGFFVALIRKNRPI
uniref:SAM-dependent MTase RsmB/NOP-type domain-containing protein n=1 Tax=Ditylum brightwellii TaxID=49249 RepID=A0A7S2ETV3_9STRA|mmetsp:Transcript_5633/g.8550  ORF Transcript_5633/g.8550 Transcript_5633/m.8550 type:complete len:583 (+) Transcript_5633:187-1935(+)